MKPGIQILLSVSALLNLAGCSCAIYHKSWERKDRKPIATTYLEELDGRLKSRSVRGVRFHADNRSVGLHSSFCPTPLTLLTRGGDVRAWEARCDKAEAIIHEWASQHGLRLEPIPLEAVSLVALNEKAIYAALKDTPVPFPKTSPYDGDTRLREAFDAGFRSAWQSAISGALLHGTFGTPAGLAADQREAWIAGWKAGAKVGSDRWLAENKRQLARRQGRR